MVRWCRHFPRCRFQAAPCAALLSRPQAPGLSPNPACCGLPCKTFSYIRQILFGNTDAGIAYDNLDMLSHVRGLNPYFSSGVRVLDCVVQHVDEHLFQPVAVPKHRRQVFGLDIYARCSPRCTVLNSTTAFKLCRNVHTGEFERDVRPAFLKIEQILNNSRKPPISPDITSSLFR